MHAYTSNLISDLLAKGQVCNTSALAAQVVCYGILLIANPTFSLTSHTSI